MRIDRMLAITVILLNKNRVSAKELAKKFEVSLRTIYRDIDAINLAGIPVISYSGNNGGFGIVDNYKIDRQILTLSDMMSILSALKNINNVFEDKEIDNAINKITSLYPKDKTEILDRHLEQIVVDIIPWGFSKNQKDKLKLINKAITELKLINFEYINTKGEKINRTCEPMTLIFKGYNWYCFGYCQVKNDFRLFRLPRMKKLNITDKTFVRKNVSYRSFNGNEDSYKNTIDVKLKFSPVMKDKLDEYFEESEMKIQKNGDIIINFHAPYDEWLISMILAYAENVEVLEPENIRQIIKEKAEKILKIYKPDIMLSK